MKNYLHLRISVAICGLLVITFIFTGILDSQAGIHVKDAIRSGHKPRQSIGKNIPRQDLDEQDTRESEGKRKADAIRQAIANLYRAHLDRKPNPGGWEHYRRKMMEDGWDIAAVERDILSSREYADKHRESEITPVTATGTVNATIGLNVRTGPGVQNSRLGVLPYGAPVTILAKQGGWYKISYGDGEAWVCGRYITASAAMDNTVSSEAGIDAPNRVSQAALDWARAQMNPTTATGVNRNNGKNAQGDPTAWNYWCLAFVATAYGRSIPELSAGSAIQSYHKFSNAGKIQTGTSLPAGAPVFWNKTGSNPYGHIAIASGKTTADGDPIILTSGWAGRNGISEMPLSQLTACCGQYLGYGIVP